MKPIGMIKTRGEVNGLTEGEMGFYLNEKSLVMASVAFLFAAMTAVVSSIGKVVYIDSVQRHKHLLITTVMNIDLHP